MTQVVRKSLLPTYDVFDEWRYFEAAAEVAPVPFRGRTLGLSICEDIWNDADFWPHRLYRGDPVETLVRAGRRDHRQHLGVALHDAEAPPAPAHAGLDRGALAAGRCCSSTRSAARTIWCSTGPAWRWTRGGQVIARGAEHDVDLVMVDVAAGRGAVAPFDPSDERSALAALALGTRDYARRCGFRQALLGLSGGIDSALVACIAARALGPRQVLGVAMPSRYSSPGSLADAEALARALGIDFCVVPIEPMFAAYLDTLASPLRELRARAFARRRGGRRRSDRPEPAGPRARRDPDGDCPTARIGCS